MMRLFHMPFSPFSRKVRLVLVEKSVDAEMIEEWPWSPSAEFRALAPMGRTPILTIEPPPTRRSHVAVITESEVICEYLEEAAPARPLLPTDPIDRAEARRLSRWFDDRFHRDVTVNLLNERVYKRLAGEGSPNSSALRAGAAALPWHLELMSKLLDTRRWLAGEMLTLADFAAAAQISTIDYTGDVPWDDAPIVKEWYALMKSRPAFRGVLADRAPGMPPGPHYADPDF